MNQKKRILVIGQTPPPFGGQALMIQALLDGEYKNAELFHVRLDFSKNFDDMGSFKLYKFWGLFKAILQAWIYRFYYNISVVYYGPAGPNKIAMLRDLILLVSTRFLFNKIILHTHAGGSSKLYKDLSFFMRKIYEISFFKPDALVTITDYSHGDDVILRPKKVFVVPNGIKDEYEEYCKVHTKHFKETIDLLYVGAMYKERGILELIKSLKIVKEEGIKARLNLMGIFISTEFEAQVKSLIAKFKLTDEVEFTGSMINNEKWEVFFNTDIFCFPTYVPSETFGIVLIESMQFKIPVVATKWNGIPFVVNDGVNGFLVEPKDPNDMALKIIELAKNEELRTRFGQNGRDKFVSDYSLDKFRSNMDKVFGDI
jgi:glycosyltransferase involved in cell wall biosynthesis